jgi:hypothetical protein
MQKMMYLLVSQHVSGIIMPIIRRMVQNRQHLWCTAPVYVHYVSCETNPNKCTPNHLFSTSLLQHGQCCTPQALSVLYHSPDDGHDDARNILRHQ